MDKINVSTQQMGFLLQFLPSQNSNLQNSPNPSKSFGSHQINTQLCDVKEIGLQKIWANQAFYPWHLKTDSGKDLIINNRGVWNNQNGPDFLEAEVIIDGIILHGAIEIHSKASDWYAHNHQLDPRFNQTVLHVVFENNRNCRLENGQALECLSLKHRINQFQIQDWEADKGLPCGPLISLCDVSVRREQLHLALTKRINEKTSHILQIHQNHHGDWWYTALEVLITAWMGSGNKVAAKHLTQHLHKSFLMRNRNPKTLIAYLFGQSSWLPLDVTDSADEYTQDLAQRYAYLQLKNRFEPCFPPWNTRQIRPNALPQIRMAQLSDFLSRCDADLHLFFTSEKFSLSQWVQHFTATAEPYWETHFMLGHESARHKTTNGQVHALQVITNALIPFMYTFGLEAHKPQLCEAAMELLMQLPAENNQITRQMAVLEIPNTQANLSQSLIGQHHYYCSQKNCAHCKIGQQILNLPLNTHSP